MADERIRILNLHLARQGAVDPRFSPVSSLQSAENFNYSVDRKHKLTPEQRKCYEENGFILVRKLVPDHKLDLFQARFRDVCNDIVASPGMTIQKDIALVKTNPQIKGDQVTYKIQDFVFDETLKQYCLLPEILDYVECFTGPDIVAIHTMLINKPPDTGKKSTRHPLHQDLMYFPVRPANTIVCSWTAMEHVFRENGCLVVYPGSHKPGKLFDHSYPDWEGGVNKLYFGVKNIPQEGEKLYVEMEKGDTIFFHPLLIHGSGMNRTSGFRKAISCHYAASNSNFIPIQGTNQEELASEVIDVFRKKTGIEDADYSLIWKAKSMLARGQGYDFFHPLAGNLMGQ